MRGRNLPTRILVVVQFALSVFLIISTIVLGRQTEFMLTKDPGFDKEGVVAIATREWDAGLSADILARFRQRVSENPNVLSVSGITGYWGRDATFAVEKDGRTIDVFQNRVDYDFFKTLDIDVVRGRAFSRDFPSDKKALVVNETFVETFEMANPIGKVVEEYAGGDMAIIGVIRDYHFQDFRRSVGPLVLHVMPDWPIRRILVRVSSNDVPGALAQLEGVWKEIQPYKPFTCTFVDESLEALYGVEKRWGHILRYSSLIAVVISCMGIFGLTSLAVSRRTKEFGIRKVLGAGVLQIGGMVVRDFVWLVVIGNVVAWPAAYYIMRSVLDSYHHRISIEPHYFLVAGMISLAVAVVTVLHLAVRTAVANPVESIRYE
jgi:putative ABC transport system permease protein